MANQPRILLLTGRPGVGKTTAILRIADRTAPRRVAGFITEELREGGVRRGFRLETFGGRTAVMAHVDFPKTNRVGKYGVDVDIIDAAAAEALAPCAADVYLVDEIGKMECMSARFVAGMRCLLDGYAPVVATIAQRGGGFIAEVKARPDVELWEVTLANREELPARAFRWLGVP